MHSERIVEALKNIVGLKDSKIYLTMLSVFHLS